MRRAMRRTGKARGSSVEVFVMVLSVGLAVLFPGFEGAPSAHPLLVHGPVVLVPLAALVFGWAALRGSDETARFGRALLGLAVASAALAIATGYRAAGALGHEAPGHQLVHVHRSWMLGAGALLLAVTVIAFVLRRRPAGGAPIVCALTLVVATVVALGADRGALLVFRYGMGVRGDAPPAGAPHRHEGAETGTHVEAEPDGDHPHGAAAHSAEDAAPQDTATEAMGTRAGRFLYRVGHLSTLDRHLLDRARRTRTFFHNLWVFSRLDPAADPGGVRRFVERIEEETRWTERGLMHPALARRLARAFGICLGAGLVAAAAFATYAITC